MILGIPRVLFRHHSDSLDDRVVDLVYDALFEKERSLDGDVEEFLDYYDFLKKINPNSVSWPK